MKSYGVAIQLKPLEQTFCVSSNIYILGGGK